MPSRHSNAMDLLQAHPRLPYAEVAAIVGDRPDRLVHRARADASAAGLEEWFLCDALVRRVREGCMEGWRSGEAGDSRASQTLAAWLADIEPLGEPWQTACKRTSDLLSDAPELLGWMPEQLEDVLPYFNRACDGVELPGRADAPVWVPTITRQHDVTTFPELVGHTCSALDAVCFKGAYPPDAEIFFIQLNGEWHRFFLGAGLLFWNGARPDRFWWTIDDLDDETLELVDLRTLLRFSETTVSEISMSGKTLRVEFANGARVHARAKPNLEYGAHVSLSPAAAPRGNP